MFKTKPLQVESVWLVFLKLCSGEIRKSFKRKTMFPHQKTLESYDLETVQPHDSTFTLQQLSCSLCA